MGKDIGNSPCPCGNMITGYLTGRVKKCDEHPGKLCWLWEWEPGTVCLKCGATQVYLHQPEAAQQSVQQTSRNVAGCPVILDDSLDDDETRTIRR